MDGLFHNRRVNAAGAALFIGLLPSAAAMLLCGDIVKSATDGYLKPREQAFVTSWFRHIPESSLPTYAGVLLMSTLSAVPLGSFMLGMIVPVLVLFALGYFPALARLPKDTGTPRSQNRLRDLRGLFLHLWTLLLIIVLILALGLSVVPAVAVSIAAGIVVYRFRAREIASMLRSVVEVKLLLNTFLLLVLKELIGYTGILEQLPDMLSALPIPAYLIFAVLFLLGGVISGASGIIALGTPIAFAAMDGGMPLMVFLMCMAHAASQISPTHVCLVVAADYFHITLGELIAAATLQIRDGVYTLGDIAVREEHRSRGFGKQMQRVVFDEARRLGVTELWASAKVPDYYYRLGVGKDELGRLAQGRRQLPHLRPTRKILLSRDYKNEAVKLISRSPSSPRSCRLLSARCRGSRGRWGWGRRGRGCRQEG
ncbi:MAG: DUF401 family protein [Oscillospiraceae bacterium]|nr:DUF401 family protein [Oscillospiraceae bacterium]